MVLAGQDNSGLANRLQPYLRPGEELLWCGHPDTAVFFTATDAFVIPFSIVWLGIATAWIAMARSVGTATSSVFPASSDAWLFGIPFLLIGIYLLVGRPVVRWLRKRRTVYGLTADRVLVLTGRSFSESQVKGGSMKVRRSRNGRHATVIFEPFGSFYVSGPAAMAGPPDPATGMATMGMSSLRRVAPGSAVFYDVANPEPLLAAVSQARSSAAH